MKTKFFSAIVLSIILLTILSSSVNAFEWNTYSKDSLNSRNPSPIYNGNLNQSLSLFSRGVGYSYSGTVGSFEVEPLTFESGGLMYMILPNGNYINVYNSNLDLIAEVFSGRVLSHLNEFTNITSSSNDSIIEGIFETNSSTISYRAYKFDTSTYAFTKLLEFNYTTNNSNFTVLGMKRNGVSSYFLQYVNNISTTAWTLRLNAVNWTSSTSLTVNLPAINSTLTEIPVVSDINNDQITEVFSFSTKTVVIYDTNGNYIYDYNYTGTSGNAQILSAKLYKSDSTNQSRIAILQVVKNGVFDRGQLILQRIDRSSLSASPVLVMDIANSGDFFYGTLGVSGRNRGSGLTAYDILYMAETTIGTNPQLNFKTYTGTGTLSTTFSSNQNAGSFAKPKLTVADMDNDNVDDFILTTSNYTWIFDPFYAGFLVNRSFIPATLGVCIPTDINFDGFLESLCSSSSGNTTYFYSNVSNQKPTIITVAYSPSLNIQVGDTLLALITATDTENNFIYYGIQCYDNAGYSSDSLSSTQSCSYNSTGIYNVSVRVKDAYHTTYNYFSILVTVTETGTSCNNNAVCEAGESNSNCPNDCPSTTTNGTVQTDGGLTINVNPVNPDNINEGFLPEIYFAMLNFFSASGYQIIIIFLVILMVLFFLSLFGVIGHLISKALGQSKR